ncbi:trypco2 family protein [Streptomyces ossamyceticus]|uniref:trypco2 family protein n=1 Tax=Streptomyces ossamyceticus TaxID=249581 RepID=UPI0006E3217B|nr:trypco2 family protein [Streptomyces ossamyceticus]
MELLRTVRRLAAKTPDQYGQWADVALLASSQWRAAGDLRNALSCAQEAVHACRIAASADQGGSDEVRLAKALLVLAESLTALGSPDEALDIFDEARSIAAEQTAKTPSAADALPVLAGALSAQAGLVAEQGDLAEALDLAHQAVTAYERLNDVHGRGAAQTLLLAKSLNSRAVIAAASGDYDAATGDMERAVDLYREAIASGARNGEALLSRALHAQNAIQKERGAGPMHDAVQGSHAYLAAARHDPQVLAIDLGTSSTSVFLTGFGPQEAAESRPGPELENSSKEGTGALAQERNTYVELAAAIEAVREELRRTAAHRDDLRFEVGPIELEFGVELREDPRSRAGVRVMVLTGGPDRTAGAAQHRIRLELTPQSLHGEALLIGDDASAPSNWRDE